MLRQIPGSGRIICRVLVVAATAVFSASWPSASYGQVSPALPQEFLDTTYAPPTGGVISVPAGGDFQAALNAAQPGQIIELAAGVTYVAPAYGFVLPPKDTPAPTPPGWNPWIYIRSSAHASLPPPGSRVSSAHASLMPKIATQDDQPAIRTGYDSSLRWVAEYPCSPSPGEGCPAHHYRFVGIEITNTAAQVANLVVLETWDRLQQSLSLVPTDIVFDRCYIHGTPTGNVRGGISMNSARTAVIDSYLSEFHDIGYEALTIMGWNGPGPFKIVNNYLEAAGENVMFGGSDASIPNLVPSDIEIRGNHFFKPLSWQGSSWIVKNLFELKNAGRVLVEGNIFENSWVGHQDGFAILFTPRNQDGSNLWAGVSDVTFRNNVVRRSAAGIHILGWDDIHSSQQLQRVLIQNNLFFDIGEFTDPNYSGEFTALLFLLKNGTADVTIDHNTAFLIYPSDPDAGFFLLGDGPPSRPVHTGFSLFNTIVPNNRWGVWCYGYPQGDVVAAMDGCFPFAGGGRNVVYGPWAPDPATTMTPNSYGRFQDGNFFPASVVDVRFEDPANCNFRLRADSPYVGLGSDGRDIGVDQNALEAPVGVGPNPGGMGRTVLSIWPSAPFCN